MLADFSLTTEGTVTIGVLLSALVTAVVFLFKLTIKTKDDQIKIYKELADEAITVSEVAADRERKRKGLGPLKRKADVVPEHSSPVTPVQQETADAATQRARLVEARLGLGLNARRVDPVGDETPSSRILPALPGT